MQKRTLTLNLDRLVDSGVPTTVEISLRPLVTTFNSAQGAFLLDAPQTLTVLVADDPVPVTFGLVPSSQEDLDEEVIYRIAWRDRYAGHQHTIDFRMPDADINFADLAIQGNILAMR